MLFSYLLFRLVLLTEHTQNLQETTLLLTTARTLVLPELLILKFFSAMELVFWVTRMPGWPGKLQKDRGDSLSLILWVQESLYLVVLLSAMTQQQVSYSASVCRGLFFSIGFYIHNYHLPKYM